MKKESIVKEKTLIKKEKIENAFKKPKKPPTLKQIMSKTMKTLKDLPEIPDEYLDKYLKAVALGLVKDRFDLDSSLDTRINAMKVLKQAKQGDGDIRNDENAIKELTDSLSERKIDGVDDEQ